MPSPPPPSSCSEIEITVEDGIQEKRGPPPGSWWHCSIWVALRHITARCIGLCKQAGALMDRRLALSSGRTGHRTQHKNGPENPVRPAATPEAPAKSKNHRFNELIPLSEVPRRSNLVTAPFAVSPDPKLSMVLIFLAPSAKEMLLQGHTLFSTFLTEVCFHALHNTLLVGQYLFFVSGVF